MISALAVLALGGCGKNDGAGNAQDVGDKVSADSIVSNDVTAIDAVTGDAANMAADVNFSETENLSDNLGNSAKPVPRRTSPRPAPTRTPDEPASNTTTASENSAQ